MINEFRLAFAHKENVIVNPVGLGMHVKTGRLLRGSNGARAEVLRQASILWKKFQIPALAPVLLPMRQADNTSWQTAILKATWWMFLPVLVFSVTFGIVAQILFPNAVTIKDFTVLLLKA